MNQSASESSPAPGGGGCPVKHSGGGASASGSGWSSWFGGGGRRNAAETSAIATPPAPEAGGSGCPVQHTGGGTGAMPFNVRSAATSAAVPASIEEAASHPQMPRPDQRIPLSTRRVVSTIPRADELRNPLENRPAGSNNNCGAGGAGAAAEKKEEDAASTCAPHQPPEHTRWVYPSEQQFYNALRRKGWRPEESTIPDVVRIHNAVNERGWSEVRKWEALRGNDAPRLVRFMGRPKHLSPRAWFNSRVLWYTEPFDRHDWYVSDDGDGEQEEPRRYVIDFYSGGDDGGSSAQGGGGTAADAASAAAAAAAGTSLPPRPPSMYIDVRPALDGPDAAIDRVKMFVRDAFPGLSAAFGMEDGAGSASSSVGNGGSGRGSNGDAGAAR